MNQQLLRRAWDALDSFKQAYPENWQEDDEQVMVDLMRADIKMSGVQPKWVGLMRGVRVDGDNVVISVKGGNDAARELCGELINEMNK